MKNNFDDIDNFCNELITLKKYQGDNLKSFIDKQKKDSVNLAKNQNDELKSFIDKQKKDSVNIIKKYKLSIVEKNKTAIKIAMKIAMKNSKFEEDLKNLLCKQPAVNKSYQKNPRSKTDSELFDIKIDIDE